MKTDFQELNSLINTAGTIVVVSHLRPDGDAVGSLLSLTLSLLAAGKKTFPVLVDGLPQRFSFLPGADLVQKQLPASWDLLICVDCSDFERTGLGNEVLQKNPIVNIDHHPTNTTFGNINYIVPAAAAAVEIVYDVIRTLHLPEDLGVRNNLMAGLLADTIGFRTSNVHAGSLRMAADLLDQGAELSKLYEQVLNQRTFAAAKYWGLGLENIQQRGNLVWTSLSLTDMQASGYREHDDADLINFLSTIEDTMVTLLFIEQPGGKVKISWRARDGIDIAVLAERFGGGGHKPAAGAMLEGSLPEVQEEVLSATIAYMNAGRN
ncbi:MAG: bifunctional oligoribonuclease/PAP phosphatase NrnA [Anaerolineales bacterium]|nr:bifunctional oligoribonuclease/PAP phosphatase NrnA [Anaerolineales bacterium]